MLQALLHPSQKKFFDLLGTHMYDLLGTIWEEFPPVILLCAVSFLLNHEDMILTCTFFGIFSRDCRRLVEALFPFKKDTRNTASSPKIMRRRRPQRRLRRSGERRRRILDAGERNRA